MNQFPISFSVKQRSPAYEALGTFREKAWDFFEKVLQERRKSL